MFAPLCGTVYCYIPALANLRNYTNYEMIPLYFCHFLNLKLYIRSMKQIENQMLKLSITHLV